MCVLVVREAVLAFFFSSALDSLRVLDLCCAVMKVLKCWKKLQNAVGIRNRREAPGCFPYLFGKEVREICGSRLLRHLM